MEISHIDPRRKKLGIYLADLRKARGLSRPKLITRLAQVLDDDDVLWDVLSEVWLKHIEQGTRVDVSRHMLDTLCRALQCSTMEEARLLWYADRNVTVSGDCEPSDADIMLNVVMGWLHNEAQNILSELLSQELATQLTEREMLAIVSKTMQIVLDDLSASAEL